MSGGMGVRMMMAGTPGVGRINPGESRRPTGSATGIFRRISRYMRPYWKSWLLILASMGVTAVGNLAPPLLAREIIDVALPNRDQWLLVWCVGVTVGIVAVTRLVNAARSTLNVRIGQGVMFDLRNELYRHLQRQSLRFFTSTRTGEVMSRVNNDVAGVEGVISSTPNNVVNNLITVGAITVTMFSLNWKLAIVALVILPLFILPARRVGRIRHKLRRETAEHQGNLTSFMQETLSISGFVLVKAFAREKLEAERFRTKSADLRDLEIRQRMVGRWFFSLLGLFEAIGPAFIYLYGGWLVITGEISIGTIVAFVAYLRNLYGPVSELANVHVDVMSSLALFERIFQYLDLEPEIVEPPNAIVPGPTRGEIRFDDVSFGYVPERLALDRISFTAEPGQLVALVGPSGAGKTTVTYLVPRFYDPTNGRIAIDGHDLRDLSLEWLRSQMGIVTQETFLFHTTVRENLLYGRPDATDEQLFAACQAAHIHDFIESLPDGYETVVGERGYRLSGGEKQRIAIARVLLKDPRILLLDEATSSLDSRSEALIQAALTPLLHGRTSLVIAHRLSTILAADVILVLDRGRLVEQGTHAELLARGGLYARLYEEQFRERTNGEVAFAATTPTEVANFSIPA